MRKSREVLPFRSAGRRAATRWADRCSVPVAMLAGALSGVLLRAFDELSDGSAKDRRQIRALVTAWRLVPSGAVRRVHPGQAI